MGQRAGKTFSVVQCAGHCEEGVAVARFDTRAMSIHVNLHQRGYRVIMRQGMGSDGLRRRYIVDNDLEVDAGFAQAAYTTELLRCDADRVHEIGDTRAAEFFGLPERGYCRRSGR